MKRRWLGDVIAALLLGCLGWWGATAAVSCAPSLLVDFGPNDADYLRGFRDGWEREGRTRFHWTQNLSTVTLPFRVVGDGALLRMRVRRHLIEPATVIVSVEAREVTRLEIQADTQVPYRQIGIPLPPLDGRHPFIVTVESQSLDPRPLGVALDWMEVERGTARFRPLPGLLARLTLALWGVYVLARVAGMSWRLALGYALLLATLALGGLAVSPLALERMVREGATAFVLTLGGLTAGALALTRRGVPRDVGAALLAIGGVALVLRFALVLHPAFYYPDVKVHALFAYELSKRGLADFMEGFTASQYRFSLGLQFENGHWYAFPYPPAFYLMCSPLIRYFGYRPEVAVSLVAAAVNTVEILLTFWLGRRLTRSAGGGLVAAMIHAVLPLFLVRLSLAYFPALVGHAVDLVAILLFLVFAARVPTPSPRAWAGLAGILALALLTYTQAVINFAVLLGGFLVWDAIADGSAAGRRRQAALALTGLAGGVLALIVFYGAYIPTLIDMRRGVPMREESILLEKQSRERPPAPEDVAVEEADPYTGSSLDLWRGVRKAAHRARVFYGPFVVAVIAGAVLAFRGSSGTERRFLVAWMATYLILNLLSGGLPGPNLLRYNKDHEIVAPLCCALGAIVWVWLRGRRGGVVVAHAYWLCWLAYGLWRAHAAFVERLVPIDR